MRITKQDIGLRVNRLNNILKRELTQLMFNGSGSIYLINKDTYAKTGSVERELFYGDKRKLYNDLSAFEEGIAIGKAIKGVCKWKYLGNGSYYTNCGDEHLCFENPEKDGIAFCPYCGDIVKDLN